MDNERKVEIETALHIITELCLKTNISLIAKDHKGQLMVVIKDELNGKEYAMCKKGAESGEL